MSQDIIVCKSSDIHKLAHYKDTKLRVTKRLRIQKVTSKGLEKEYFSQSVLLTKVRPEEDTPYKTQHANFRAVENSQTAGLVAIYIKQKLKSIY